MQALIDDGYTVSAWIDEQPLQHPKLEFTYRPFAGFERSDFAAELTAIEDDRQQRAQLLYKMLSDRILKWSLENPPCESSFRLLDSMLLQKLIDILMGYSTPDGTLTDEVGPEADAKNSPAG